MTWSVSFVRRERKKEGKERGNKRGPLKVSGWPSRIDWFPPSLPSLQVSTHSDRVCTLLCCYCALRCVCVYCAPVSIAAAAKKKKNNNKRPLRQLTPSSSTSRLSKDRRRRRRRRRGENRNIHKDITSILPVCLCTSSWENDWRWKGRGVFFAFFTVAPKTSRLWSFLSLA